MNQLSKTPFFAISFPINEVKTKQSYTMSRPQPLQSQPAIMDSLLISRMSPTSAFEELPRSFRSPGFPRICSVGRRLRGGLRRSSFERCFRCFICRKKKCLCCVRLFSVCVVEVT
ncbi:hypothetical protein CEXT_616291 [Caerostris extrusa]|uniref:Uncharacterized protein n=1 Tax=Caerostris extrusa TaxID=172846 RepID=A0AAV4P595_CAEEX|nr:hypothetical protein CEXT_616291 [Caerostris extrusa]